MWWWPALTVGACLVTLAVVFAVRRGGDEQPLEGSALAAAPALPVVTEKAPPPVATTDLVTPPDAAAPDAAAPIDAAAPPPPDAGPPPRPASQRPPTTPSTRDAEVVLRWSSHHRRMVRGFEQWVDQHEAAATALKSWDTRYEKGSGELVTWLAENSAASLGDYVAANPKTSFAAIYKKHRGDLEALLPWLRSYTNGMQTLARKGQGFPWAATRFGATSPPR
jgi:hypothetical protein